MDDDKKILRAVVQSEKGDEASHADYVFWCPACKCGHAIWTTKHNHQSAVWEFNGNMEKPTFKPSLKIEWWQNPPFDPTTGDFKRGTDGNYLLDSDKRLLGAKHMICHSIVTDGVIHYCPDCTHELAGQNVPMQPF